ncbi:MAG TPA: PHB depolymerase family esterase [Polyangia bacterium]|nr:PHB depolymerase family esterase [Polyangia bacterium]
MSHLGKWHVGSALLAGALLLGCSSSGGVGPSGTGGTTSSTGGTTSSTGGTTATGGSHASGGSTGAGGTPASGGTTGTGGMSQTGAGGSATGGAVTTGTGGSAGHGGPAGAGGHGGPGSGGSAGSSSTGSGGSAGKGGPGTGGTAGSSSTGSGGSAGGSGTVTCPTPVLKSGDSNQTVMVGTSSRTYILHVPSAYNGTKAVPLVVDFHPLGGSGSSEEGSSPYKAQTDPEGVISAYPNGLSGPSGGAWNVGPCCVANVDDVAFARALVAQVETKACIDTHRVYAVGFSMGGGMSHYVACHAADIFAAAAPASFDLLKENEAGCTPPRPIAVISFRSSNDPIVPYAGGASSVVSGMPITFLGAVGTFQKWAMIDGCTGSPTAADSNDCQYYNTCSGGVKLGLCTMTAGHAPGEANIGWPFIKQFTLP